ncbi:hypothetical protein BT69DRAFT_1291335 [Atractiella rhizophila]|nr:hypothetical protein BT69DRAFT_1291335 [Atractiella rhizophila]
MALFWISFGDTVNKSIFYVSYMQSVALDGPHLFFIPITRSIIPSTIFQGILTVSVQLLYIYRILRIIRGIEKFNPSHHLARLVTYVCLCVSGALIIASLVGFIIGATVESGPIVDFFPHLIVPAILALGCATGVDVILCACMVYHLQQHKIKSDFQKTSFMATRFIKLTLETGLIPTITQLVELLLIILKPRTGLWGAFGYFIAKLYVIAALVLYEAAFATKLPAASHERANTQSTRERSRAQFDQIFAEVTEVSVQQADVIEQAVQLEDVKVHSHHMFGEKKADTISNLSTVHSYEV